MTNFITNKLREIQKSKGYISEKDMKEISKDLQIPISQVYGVATFYKQFQTKEIGKNIIQICCSPSCYINGAFNLIEYIKKKLKIDFGETTKDKKITLLKSSCIGCCDKSPAMLLNGKAYCNLTEIKLDKIIQSCKS